ncbi:MAG: endonuclease MutS2 [Bacteroidales bacterium]
MIYPENFEKKTGFDVLRKTLLGKCQSEAGKRHVENMHFMTNAGRIEQELAFVEEKKQCLLFHESFPFTSFPDIQASLNKLTEEDSVLLEEEFHNIHQVLQLVSSLKRYSGKLSAKKFPLLKQTIEKPESPDYVKNEIRRIFTSKGYIKSSASKELQALVREESGIENKISGELDNMMKKAVHQGWTEEDTSVAVIDGYRAIPLSAMHKRKMKGIVVGESATGKTVYVEPESVSQYNHRLRNIAHEIKAEKQKILASLTDAIREYQPELEKCLEMLAEIDFQRAKARLALDLECIKPGIAETGTVILHKVRHPLLVLYFKAQNREVVPFDIEFNQKHYLYVISGPNAGGKTVSLQAAGLVQYMLQCGMQAPVGGNTQTRTYRNIFLDLGDDQSLDNDLSTYSSHLNNMKFMLDKADKDSMILIDEFGGGTEPDMGAAIAEAMLQRFADNKVSGIVTTHYGNLKHFASNYPGLENAAMLIDTENMTPMYQLQTGVPGSSYSFDIAERSGIPHDIIALAKTKTGREKFNFDKHLRQVIKDKKYWENKRKEINQENAGLQAELNRHKIAWQGFERNEKKLIDQARAEADRIIKSANRQIEKTIREIRQAQAEKEKTKAVRAALQKTQQKLKQEPERSHNSAEIRNFKNSLEQASQQKAKPKDQTRGPVIKKEIRPGSLVYIKHLDQIGEVIDIGEKNYVVSLGNMMTSIEKHKVKLAENQKKQGRSKLSGGSSYLNRMSDFQHDIDLRGKRVDEAMSLLIDFIDNAVVAGARQVKILHGKGGGILRSAIRDYLSRQQEVERFEDEDIRQGGDGITVVSLRV